MDDVIRLLNYLRGNSQVEINENCNTLSNLRDSIGKKQRYFCAGLGEKISKRCDDKDIKTKKYFVADIDIRLTHYEKYGVILTQEELNEKINDIIFRFGLNGYGDYTAIVGTGNGVHFYWTGTERKFDIHTYSNGVAYIYGLLDDSLKDLGYVCDFKCRNLSRVTRLPGSINPRKKLKKDIVLWDMGDYVCDIRYYKEQDSKLFEDIEKYAELYKKDQEEIKQARIEIKEIIKKDYKNISGDNIRQQINNIPAYEIACDIRPVTFRDGEGLDNVPLKEKNKNMGAYWWRPTNVIVNTGSSLIKTNKSYFTPYELVYYELMGQDKKATVDYFKDKYGIKDTKEIVIEQKIDTNKIGYIYPAACFDKFDCMMSGELVTIIAESNSGKTTFAMDIIQANSKIGKRGFYINLEFDISTMWKNRWLWLNGKKKRNLTDLDPLSEIDKTKIDNYVKQKLSQFDYYNQPNGMELSELVELIKQKESEGYGMFVIDTFSRIKGNLDSNIARTSQNKSMEVMQELVQKLNILLINLHHTNKQGTFEGSQKIMDLSNVFIVMTKEEDADGKDYRKFTLSKDKFVTKSELDIAYINQEYFKF